METRIGVYLRRRGRSQRYRACSFRCRVQMENPKGLNCKRHFCLRRRLGGLPIFAALPFLMGATQSSVVDAVFEATSGLTTTGSTVISGLDDLPRGLLLWRGF